MILVLLLLYTGDSGPLICTKLTSHILGYCQNATLIVYMCKLYDACYSGILHVFMTHGVKEVVFKYRGQLLFMSITFSRFNFGYGVGYGVLEQFPFSSEKELILIMSRNSLVRTDRSEL